MPDTFGTRRGHPLLLVAFVLAAVVVTTIFYREGASGPLHRTRTAVLSVAAPVASAGTWVMTPLRSVGRFIGDVNTSPGEVETMRRQNAELRDRLAELEEARQENARLKALVQFAQATDLKTVGARIVGRPSSSWEGVLLLDRGTADGVSVGMPVVAGKGLVGQVVDASAHECQVRLITHPRSGVASIIQRTRATGVTRGSVEGVLTLDFVDPSAKPKRGDVVITSGLGGRYPKGLVVGDVSEVSRGPADLHPKVTVVSRVPVQDIEEVLILVVPVERAGVSGE